MGGTVVVLRGTAVVVGGTAVVVGGTTVVVGGTAVVVGGTAVVVGGTAVVVGGTVVHGASLTHMLVFQLNPNTLLKLSVKSSLSRKYSGLQTHVVGNPSCAATSLRQINLGVNGGSL